MGSSRSTSPRRFYTRAPEVRGSRPEFGLEQLAHFFLYAPCLRVRVPLESDEARWRVARAGRAARRRLPAARARGSRAQHAAASGGGRTRASRGGGAARATFLIFDVRAASRGQRPIRAARCCVCRAVPGPRVAGAGRERRRGAPRSRRGRAAREGHILAAVSASRPRHDFFHTKSSQFHSQLRVYVLKKRLRASMRRLFTPS